EIVSHFFFQRHGPELHAFSAWVCESHRREDLIATVAMDFVAYAVHRPGAVRIRVGAGGNPLADRWLAPLKPVANGLGWRMLADGWVDFGRRCNEQPTAETPEAR